MTLEELNQRHTDNVATFRHNQVMIKLLEIKLAILASKGKDTK